MLFWPLVLSSLHFQKVIFRHQVQRRFQEALKRLDAEPLLFPHFFFGQTHDSSSGNLWIVTNGIGWARARPPRSKRSAKRWSEKNRRKRKRQSSKIEVWNFGKVSRKFGRVPRFSCFSCFFESHVFKIKNAQFFTYFVL